MILLYAAIALICVYLFGLIPLSGFHLLAYYKNTTNTTAIDMTAAPDPIVSQRNGHYLLTDKWNMIAATVLGATVTEANILSPTLNAVGKFNINPVNVSDTVPSPPRMDFWMGFPMPLPEQEEIQLQVNASGTDTVGATGLLWIATPSWNDRQSKGIPPLPMFTIKFTATPTLVPGQWSTIQQLTFEQSLRGGTYAIAGMEIVGTNVLAGRVVLPQGPQINGRTLRAGVLASNTYGDVTLLTGTKGPFAFGQFGIFSTAELPQMDFIGVGTGTPTVSGYFRLVRLTDSDNMTINYGSAP